MQVGFGRADISVYEPGMAMMGWGSRTNLAQGITTPLSARALVLVDPEAQTRVAFVVVELLLVTQGLWRGVLEALAERCPELGFGPDNVILAATHTHSGPSGFGHHFWTNLNAPGWSAKVYDGLVDGVVDAIVQAHARRTEASLAVTTGALPKSDGVAFNRSLEAYNRNPDVQPATRPEDATDRLMTVLRATSPRGDTIGMVNWLGLHGTCVHSDHQALHPDHKGLAALSFEAEGLPVVFAQECCGDISPNYRPDQRRGHTIGRFEDDLETARYVADSQIKLARQLLAEPGASLEGPLQVSTRFVDFSNAPVDAAFAPDGRPRRTRPATLGVSMALGTEEGPGPLRRSPWVARTLNRLAGRIDGLRARLDSDYERRHDPKFPLVQLGKGLDGRLAGMLPMRRGLVPPVDATFAWVGKAIRSGGVPEGPWIPNVVPLQLVRVGSLAIVSVPFEMTTVAGRRLRATIAKALPDVEHVVVSTYASAYVGYMTTYQEYQVQEYEGGYTLFGPFALGALRTAAVALCGQLREGVAIAGRAPDRVATAPLQQIAFDRPWPGA